ncbi:alpha/beta hydrolase [Corallococcus sp. H22C18031201]|uniref:alpha/beta hydrolase n=1 Tax=Citreicoccus inhibens TaxID=2849499 RepID=UPI000E75B22A|nr:alpha/beta fold hydrolase [Citreicoccus inhibens]MBU8898104.1 alpha/beta fold hydrolase [Citreicoccus inhibens]RJS17992.1 alpha/beta hydrolase [Corallococcus sp. H22C18031201]
MTTSVRAVLPRLVALGLALGGVGLPAVLGWQGWRTAQGMLHPSRVPVVPPDATGPLAGMERVSFQGPEGHALRGWYVPSRDGSAVVLVHGFAANRAQLLFEARALAEAGHGVLLFDLRAQGESDGDAVTWGDRERGDVRAALAFVASRPDVEASRLGLLGFSMGGATALLVAQEEPRVRAVAAVGAFPVLEADVHSCYGGRLGRLNSLPVVWSLRRAGVDVDAVRPLDGMARLEGRALLLINGDTDPDGPAKLDGSLYRAAHEPRTLWRVPGATHGEYARVDPVGYAHQLRAFFSAALAAYPRAENSSP